MSKNKKQQNKNHRMNKYLYVGGAVMIVGKSKFYDNDSDHIRSVFSTCPRIDSIQVNEYNLDENRAHLLAYTNDRLDNGYAQLINSNINYSETTIGPGFNEFAEVITWAAEERSNNVAIFFDWDRTISLTEGFLPVTIDHMRAYNFTTRDMVTYLCGSEERVRKFITMFSILNNNNIDIFIISANGSCHIELFKNLVRILLPYIEDDHILCSRPTAKGQFISENPLATAYC